MPAVHPAQAVLFDLDGTLVDSFGAIAASVNHVRSCRDLPPLPLPTVRQAVGHGLYRLMEVTVPAGTLQENAEIFLAHHPTVVAAGTTLLDGVGETLEFLHAQGVPLAVCSNKPLELTHRVLAATGLDRLMRLALGPESVPKRKPAPDMLLEALRQLAVPAAQAAYVGDMDVDFQAGQAAGVPVYLIPTGPMDYQQLAGLAGAQVLHRFADLRGVIA